MSTPALAELALQRTLTQDETGECVGSRNVDVAGTIDVLRAELRRHRDILNTPLLEDFLDAVDREAKHQRARWSDEHDARKGPEDWLWTLAYLATKALEARRHKDREKYLHHLITAAALLANWHRYALADRFGP